MAPADLRSIRILQSEMNEDFVMSDHTNGGAHVRGSTINESQNEQLKED